MSGSSSSSGGLAPLPKVGSEQSSIVKVVRNYRQDGVAMTGTAALIALWAVLPLACDENSNLILAKDQCVANLLSWNYATNTNSWDCQMVWVDPTWGAVGSFDISFDISGQTQHITNSITTVASYSPDSVDTDPPDFSGAINVMQDHSVGGVDTTIPALSVVYNCNFSPSAVTEEYIAAVSNCVGKVAAADMFGFAQGSLMLTRATGQRKSGELWTISFAFSVLPNKSSFTVGSGTYTTTIDVKKGWDYLWVYYEITDRTVPGIYAITPQIKGVYIEQVFDTADYTILGISSLTIAGSGE